MKTTVLRKHIHSSNSSFCSGDEFLYFEIKGNLDFTPAKDLSIFSKKFPLINGERIHEIDKDKNFTIIYLNSDKSFHYGRIGDNHKDDPNFKSLVQSYIDKGLSKTEPKSLRDFYDREKIKQSEKERKAGVVLWMDFETYYRKPEYYQGGFSNELFNDEGLQSYIRGGAHGWIGHSSGRKAWHDKLIEEGLKERGLCFSRMKNWITSSSGRHFGDSLEGYNKKEQTEKIKRNLNDMFNCCLIYGAPEHKGMYTDTVTINQKFQELGLLLSTKTGKFNKKQYAENLCKVIKELSKNKKMNKMEIYVYEFVRDVFANLTSPLV